MKNIIHFLLLMVLVVINGNKLNAQWIETNGLYIGTVDCFAVSPAADGTGGANLFAGTYGSGVFLSTNDGTSWTDVNSGLPTNTNVSSFAVSGTNLFAGAFEDQNLGRPGGVFLSTDNGGNWTAVGNGLTNINVRALAISDTNLFAGTGGGGVFRSTNNGINWIAFNIGLTNLVVNTLLVYGSNIFAGTDNGVWRRPLSDITDIEDLGYEIPTQFVFEQNYPYPFNPSTKISWQSPVSGWQTIKLFDILGKEVETLVDENKPAGKYEVEFDASQLSSGTYFYSLRAGSFVETKKMILLR